MDEIRKSGKTIDEAVAAALAELQAEKDEVTITVIEEGSKGFLGMFGGKDAVVLVKKNFNPEKAAENFLREVFLSMGLIIKIETKMQDKHLLVDLTGDDMGILIGKRGQTLDALPGSQQKQRVLHQRDAGYRKLPPEKKRNTGNTGVQPGEKGKTHQKKCGAGTYEPL